MSTGVLQRLDQAQTRSTTLSVAVATFKRFSDDKSAIAGWSPRALGRSVGPGGSDFDYFSFGSVCASSAAMMW
jgi:hypothetical protein